MEPVFPVEFLVEGTPVSLQAKRVASIVQWKERVKHASAGALPEGHWATASRVATTLYYFPEATMEGDLDNIIKPILDALKQYVYIDDTQVERIVAQRFEPGNVFIFTSPSLILQEALVRDKPVLYVRVSTDPFEDLI